MVKQHPKVLTMTPNATCVPGCCIITACMSDRQVVKDETKTLAAIENSNLAIARTFLHNWKEPDDGKDKVRKEMG